MLIVLKASPESCVCFPWWECVGEADHAVVQVWGCLGGVELWLMV